MNNLTELIQWINMANQVRRNLHNQDWADKSWIKERYKWTDKESKSLMAVRLNEI